MIAGDVVRCVAGCSCRMRHWRVVLSRWQGIENFEVTRGVHRAFKHGRYRSTRLVTAFADILKKDRTGNVLGRRPKAHLGHLSRFRFGGSWRGSPGSPGPAVMWQAVMWQACRPTVSGCRDHGCRDHVRGLFRRLSLSRNVDWPFRQRRVRSYGQTSTGRMPSE